MNTQESIAAAMCRHSHELLDAAGVCQGGALTTRIGLLVKELAETKRQADARLCDACFEHHPLGVMCPPHEVRTTGQAWFRERVKELEARLAAAEQRERALREAVVSQVMADDGPTCVSILQGLIQWRDAGGQLSVWAKLVLPRLEAALAATQTKGGSDAVP